MKHITNILAGVALATLLAACSEQAGLVYYDEYLMVRGRVSGQGHQQRKINNDAHN